MPYANYVLQKLINVKIQGEDKYILCDTADTDRSLSISYIPETFGAAITPHVEIGDQETTHTVSGPALLSNENDNGGFLYDVGNNNTDQGAIWDIPTLALNMLYQNRITLDVNTAIKNIKFGLSNTGGLVSNITYCGDWIDEMPLETYGGAILPQTPYRESNYYDFKAQIQSLHPDDADGDNIGLGMISGLNADMALEYVNPEYIGKPPTVQYCLSGGTFSWDITLAFDWAAFQSIQNALEEVSQQEASQLTTGRLIWKITGRDGNDSNFTTLLSQVLNNGSYDATDDENPFFGFADQDFAHQSEDEGIIRATNFVQKSSIKYSYPMTFVTLSGIKVFT